MLLQLKKLTSALTVDPPAALAIDCRATRCGRWCVCGGVGHVSHNQIRMQVDTAHTSIQRQTVT